MNLKQQEERWRFQVKFIQDHAVKLNDWEERFISSINDQLDRGKVLTEKQEQSLERIWEKA